MKATRRAVPAYRPGDRVGGCLIEEHDGDHSGRVYLRCERWCGGTSFWRRRSELDRHAGGVRQIYCRECIKVRSSQGYRLSSPRSRLAVEAVRLLRQGLSIHETALAVEVARQTVEKWYWRWVVVPAHDELLARVASLESELARYRAKGESCTAES